MHPLLEALLAAADGRFSAIDGLVDVVDVDVVDVDVVDVDHHAVVEFTGHAFVLTDLRAGDVLARRADGFGGASQPDVLRWLAGPDGWIGSHDAVLVARGIGGGRLPESSDHETHPQVVQVAAGNAASLRAFLSCGFVPIGAEILFGLRRSDISTALS